MLLTVIMAFAGAQTAGADNVMYVIAEELSGNISISQMDADNNSSSLSVKKVKLTFYYGERPTGYTEGSDVWSQRTESFGGSCIFDVPTSLADPAWLVLSEANKAQRNEAVVQVVLDASFSAARPQYTYEWFYNMKNLIEANLLNLNVENLTYAKLMFFGCSNLRYIYCDGNWDTSTLSSSFNMFKDCTSLPGYPSNPGLNDTNKTKAKPQPDGYFTSIGLTWNADGSYFEINDEQDLIDLGLYVMADATNDCAGLTFKLNRDLDFSDRGNNSDCHNKSGWGQGNFLPIGLAGGTSQGGAKFAGRFYGQGHSITGLRYNYSSSGVGLFGKIEGSAVVDGVTLISPTFRASGSVGGIAGISYGATISNCAVVNGSIDAGTNSDVGGIVGKIASGTNSISGCTVVGTTVSGDSNIGGIVGYITSGGTTTISGCTVVGTSVSSNNNLGIIVGGNNATLTISGCTYHNPDGLTICGAGSYTGSGNKRVYQLTLGEGITASGATYSHVLVPGKAYYANGSTVTLGHGTREGYVFGGGYTASPAQTISNGTFTMPEEDVSVSASWTDMFGMEGGADGSAEHPYLISSTAGWNFFCDALQDNTTYNRFSGKTVKLGADITVSRMAGSSGHDFCGTFDGGGHTLTVNYSATENNAAPFLYMVGGRIENLRVCGTIETSAKYAAGLIAHQYGSTTIKNCHSSVTIRSNFSGDNSDGTHGGFVAVSEQNATLTIEGCLFDGKLLTTGTKATDHCAGFVGYRNNSSGTTVTVKNSLYAPAAAGEGETWVGTTESATFVRSGSHGVTDITNSYYTRTLGSAQGKLPHTVTAGANVTIEAIALTGDATPYDLSGITAYSGGGLTTNNGATLYYGYNDAVSLTLADDATDVPTGYVNKDGYTVSAGTLSGSTLTMPDNDAVVSVKWTPDPNHFAVNAAGTEYTIYTATGWNVFCDALDYNGTYNRFSGKTVKLGADIGTAQNPITRMAGKNSHDFCGTFDGGGYTLTVNISSDSDHDYTAPFSYVANAKANPGDTSDSPAAIRNLNVAGTVNASKNYASGIVGAFWGTLTIEDCTSSVNINTGNKDAAGFIGRAAGNVTMRNCLSSVTINSSTGGDGTHGGFIGVAVSGKTFTIEGCAFTGSLLSTGTGENATTHCGGFVGWNGGTLNIRNSLFAPASVSVGASNSATFSRYEVGCVTEITNSYYTSELNDGEHFTGQGKQLRSIAAGEGVNLGHDGAATEYSVSGITAYKASGASGDSDPFIDGLVYNEVLYAGSGDAVSLTLTNSVNGDAPLGYKNGYYTVSGGATRSGSTLYMADDDVTISFTPGDLRSTGEAVPVSYINADGQPDSHDAIAIDETMNTLGQGGEETWYFVGADINYSGQINCRGDVNIILADGYTMTVNNNDGIFGLGDTNEILTIYGQTLGTGTLDITATNKGIKYGIVVIRGGTVNATGTNSYGISADGNVTITGGQVTATGSYQDGIFAYGDITLGWTKATDFIKASSYNPGSDGGVNIVENQTLYDEDGNEYSYNYYGVSIPDGVTLRPYDCRLALSDAADNSAAIDAANGKVYNVTLQGRTLYKDGAWNTLCLPFSVGDGEAESGHELDGTPLEGATLMTLGNSQACNTGFDPQTGTLNLDFLPAKTVEPGVAYIVKWPIPDGMTADEFAAAYAANPDDYDLKNPVFTAVTVTNDNPADHATTSADTYVTFVGTYSPAAIYADPATALYLGAANKLYWPSTDGYTVNAFRAYFQLNNGLTCGDPTNPNAARAITLNFGDSSEAQGIGHTEITEKAGAWYDMQGRKLQGQPTKKGLYIHGGKKVVVP